MSRYFDICDWKLDEVCNSLRERIADSKKKIPKKLTKHCVSIRYKIGKNCYHWGSNMSWIYDHDEFTTYEQAEKYMSTINGIKKIGDNCWINSYMTCDENNSYIDENGNQTPYHYELYDYDYEQYEDGQDYIEYTKKEKKYLKDTLKYIEKARAYFKAYDNACDNCSFGGGSYEQDVDQELLKFKTEYTENLPDDYYTNTED